MASANSALQISNLDFVDIKNSLKTFLQSQDTLKDYNFEGSALSVLLDVLAYNTQYNAYYLNMVANELFLDSAIMRSSVVSHAKTLGYTPRSAKAPYATINLRVNQVNDASLTVPKFTSFLSEAIDGVNYNFVTTNAITVGVSANTATFNELLIYQGTPASYSYVVNNTTNPSLIFQLPDANIDTSTIQVLVQESSSNTSVQTYTRASNYTSLNSSSQVYFLQEAVNGNYEIYFGDDVLGKKLVDGNIVNVTYLITNGTSGAGANNFVLMNPISGYGNTVITPITAATQGLNKETIDSIKFTAPKAYSAQGRAVTKEDYIYLIQSSSSVVPIEAVNVWGGEENNPPAYGKIFIAIKPSGGYTLTPTQKQKLLVDVIQPISVLTVSPTIVDPDYTYIKLVSNVLYDQKRTTLTSGQIESLVINAINSFATTTLNTFNSQFVLPSLISTIQNSQSSIITNDTKIQLQKKFYPNLINPTNYNFYFGTPLKKDYFNSPITSYPSMSYKDSNGVVQNSVFIGEIEGGFSSTTSGVGAIYITNTGFGYTSPPIVTIQGDGIGATAHAVINSGKVVEIVVDDPGYGYTQAIVTITNAGGDTTGTMASALANVNSTTGLLYLYNYVNGNRNIINPFIGAINYAEGVITLINFAPYQIDNELSQLTITATPETTIFSSSQNRIITVDSFDPTAITVNVTAK